MTLNTSPLFGVEWDLRVSIDAAADAGFRYIALDTFAVDRWREQGHDLIELTDYMDGRDVSCWSLAPLVIGPDAAVTRRAAVRVAADAARLGAPWVEVHVHAEDSDDSHRAFAEATRIVAGTGCQVALEFVAWHPVSGIAEARRYIERPDAAAARLVVDPWHYFRGTSTSADLIDLPAEQIGYVQFDDALPAGHGTSLREQAIYERTFPGHGEFDLLGWVATIRSKGFDGMVSIEVLADRWRQANADQRAFAAQALLTSAPYWTVQP